MSSWNEEDAEGEIDYELETSPTTPKARPRVTSGRIVEGAWLSGRSFQDEHGDDIDKFVQSFRADGESSMVEDYIDDEPPLEMPPTPRMAKATLPSASNIGRAIFGKMPNEDADDAPAFLTPFKQRKTHPYNRSADYVLAQVRKREAGMNRPPPGTIRPRRKRAQREITNLCVFTLQRNFSKALLDAHTPPKEQKKLPTPPGIDHAPPAEIPWWGDRISPPTEHLQLYGNTDDDDDSDYPEDEDDDDVQDRGLWAEQSYGIGLGLGLGTGFDFRFPSQPQTSSARSLPQAERFVDPHSPSPPLTRTPSGKGVPRAVPAAGVDALSPALDLADRSFGTSSTPSPGSPEIVTPEFDQETGRRTVLVKENYKERPGQAGPMFNHPWYTQPLCDDDEDEDDDERPLWPRPVKKDKGKGRALPEDIEESSTSTRPEEAPVINIPSHIPIDPSLSDEVNYSLMADFFGVDAEELAMQYMLEMSKLDTGKAVETLECGDSPGASGSGLPPCHPWNEDEGVVDYEMSDNRTRSRSTSSTTSHSRSSSSTRSNTPCSDNYDQDGASINSWFNGHTDNGIQYNIHQRTSPTLHSRMEYGDEVGPFRIGHKRKAI
jgi:hypothetical protein